MSTNTRDARRRRILQGSQDRLALITGRVQNLPSTASQSDNPDAFAASDEDATDNTSPPLVSGNLDPKPRLSDLPQVSHHEADKPTDYMVSRPDQAAESNQNDGLGGGSREEPSLRRRGTSNEPSRASASQVRITQEPSSAIQRTPLSASSRDQSLGTLVNLFSSVTSQQLSSAVAATEQTRRMFSITMSLLVLLCYFGFPIVSNKIIRSIILFRPCFLLLLSNMSLIILRLLSEFEKGDKDARKLTGSDGLGWAEEAGMALEVGLMLQNVMSSLFMDFSVYALIIVCGFCLAG